MRVMIIILVDIYPQIEYTRGLTDGGTKVSRPSKQQLLPYKILTVALYGQMSWISRDSLGVVRLPVPKLASHFKTRAGEINDAVQTLSSWGLIQSSKSWGSFVELTPHVPQGMCLVIDAPAMRVYPQQGVDVIDVEETGA